MTFDAVAVTGATGRLGNRVAHRIAGRGSTQRLIVRDPARAPALGGAEVRQADYRDADASRAALAGISTVFMVSAAEAADRVDHHRTFVDAAVAAGVNHIVYTSFLGAAPDSTFTLARDHYATEEHIKASGLSWTFFRDNLYLDVLPLFAGDAGVLRGPAGDGRVSAVARDDVADAAVTVLTAPAEHAGRTYDLTGPEAISLAEVAEIITTATGRAVRYHPETVEEAYLSRAHYGAPDWMIDAWVTTYTAIAAGELAEVTDHVTRLTEHRPRSLADLLRSAPTS